MNIEPDCQILLLTINMDKLFNLPMSQFLMESGDNNTYFIGLL